jgi:hypothetical protein
MTVLEEIISNREIWDIERLKEDNLRKKKSRSVVGLVAVLCGRWPMIDYRLWRGRELTWQLV